MENSHVVGNAAAADAPATMTKRTDTPVQTEGTKGGTNTGQVRSAFQAGH
jgi:hypothetical protein